MSDKQAKNERREDRHHAEVMQALEGIRARPPSTSASRFNFDGLGIVISLVGSGLVPTVFWKCFTFGLAYLIAWASVLPNWWPLRLWSLRWRRVAFGVVTLLAILIAWKPVGQAYHTEMAAKYSGILVAIKTLNDIPPKFPCIEIGLTQLCDNGSPNAPLITFSNDTDIRLRLDKGGTPQISLVIRNSNGIVIADVENNEWSVNPDKSVSWDHNYTQDRLEVLDGQKHVVLELQALPDAIKLDAIMWRHGANGLGVNAITGNLVEKTGSPKMCDKHDMTTCWSLEPAFVYPSSEHWGELVNGK